MGGPVEGTTGQNPPPVFIDGNGQGNTGQTAPPPDIQPRVEKQDLAQFFDETPIPSPSKGPKTPEGTPPPADSGDSDNLGNLPASDAAAISIPEVVPEESEALPTGFKEVLAVFFYPEGSEEILELVFSKFQEVIKKHKLKFRLKRVQSEPYPTKGKVNYTSFVDVCKNAKVPVAIVIGPPPNVHFPQQDFYDLLTVTLDVQGISLQLINWSEVSKDYRYLNLSLDIALVKGK